MDNIQLLRAELEILKEKCEEEEKRKSKTILAKLEADDLHKEAEQQVNQLLEKSSEIEETLSEKKKLYHREMQKLEREKEELMSNIDVLDGKIKNCTETFQKTRNELRVDNTLPHKNINCTKEESDPGNLSNIPYTCHILIQYPYILQDGQALLTFEKETVAQGIIDLGRHNVEFSNGYEEVKAYKVQLGRTLAFEVNMTIANTKVNVRNLPTCLPEETLKDKLELTFYKSNIGGGEIESVEYNKNNNSACITYKENGVAQRVLEKTQHQITAGDSTYEIGISPSIEKHLNKLQIFSGICRRTVLLAEIRNQIDCEDDIQDFVEIHFQKPSNGGDEVECIAFSHKNKLALFEEDQA
ncbi:N-myc-interactor [Rhinoderma darwinii]|uniref:N-myc-interactor n=1 Tax=Rhinoderma darwinii TaxID=43563 RepID=UPI003F66645A